MSGVWRTENKDVFTRNLLRDFCKVHAILQEQSARFSHSGTVSYAVLRDLLGEPMRKGLFWQLKDTAHHLFRKGHKDGISESYPPEQICQSLLDWCIGYAFHECVKLKEDAFQRQHYRNRLQQIKAKAKGCEQMIADLEPYTEQTHQSMEREIARILGIFAHGRSLLLQYLKQHAENGHVARLIVIEEELIKPCFIKEWDLLMQSLYEQKEAKLFCLAAEASLDNGQMDEAKELLQKAEQCHKHDDKEMAVCILRIQKRIAA